MRRSLVSLLSVIILTSSFNLNIFAKTNDNLIEMKEVEVEAYEYIQKVSDEFWEDWKGANLGKGLTLYDFEGNITAYLFPVQVDDNKKGYVIFSANKMLPGLIESAREGGHPYENVNGKLIYVGPLMYFSKKNFSDSKIFDIRMSKNIDKVKLKSKGPLSSENIAKFAETNNDISNNSIYATSSSQYKLISGVPDFQWYIGCSPTSGANIIKWWDNNGKSNLVSTSTSINALIRTLAEYMGTNWSTGGTAVSDMAYGIRQYISSKGYTSSVTMHRDPSFSTYKSEISNGRPNWVTTLNHPTYDTHAVTGVGYEDIGYMNAIVHDTWGSTSRDVWLRWNSYFHYVINVRVY
ncbi:C39 family peptidase [Salirhabdus sp. Marseille-P4669]|uniref:C39 family peptidase n=1 Tax=Salirhabdus sp. Marseille-P4669 TaxID=2042310 RepID=UPI000C7BECEE|nr:C39 family peptidase [Salirhabdus sp. Marseille-P4669]